MSVEATLQVLYNEKQRLFKVLLNLIKMSKIETLEADDEELVIVVDKGFRQQVVEVLKKLGYKSGPNADPNYEYFDKAGYGGVFIENGMGQWIITVKYAQSQIGEESIGTKVFLEFMKSIPNLPSAHKKVLYRVHTSDSPRVPKMEYDLTFDYVKKYWEPIDETHYVYKGLYANFFPKNSAVLYSSQPETSFTDYDDDRI